MGRADENEDIRPSLDELWNYFEELKKHCYRQCGRCEGCLFYKEMEVEEGQSYGYCRIRLAFPQ